MRCSRRKCDLVSLVLLGVTSLQAPLIQAFPLSSSSSSSSRQYAIRSSQTRATKLLQRVAVTPTDTPLEANGLDTSRIRSFYLTRDEIKPILKLGKGDKEKIVNAFGLWCLVVSLITCPIWAAAMNMLNLIYRVQGDAWDPNRSLYDTTGKLWAKSWLTLSNSMPTFSGHIEHIQQQGGGPCLYVANHASWLDIPILCTVLDPVFKFIAKGELRGVPCIGQQLVGGQHILIDREDRKSQIRTFKDGIRWLKRGVPLMAFPEGKRSNDGRLMEFKGGLFSMAVKVKCPIVPITISHAQAVMPCNALFPVQSGRGKLHVHVHEPIHAVGRSEDELVELVRRAFVSTLPLEQQPLESAARIPADGVPSERGLDERETHHQESVISREVVDSSPVAEVTIELSNVHAIPVPGTSDDPTSEILEMAT